jgi:hypothetical protein
MKKAPYLVIATVAVAGSYWSCNSTQEPGPPSFFITSVGTGDGANLGGLAGADAHCQKLASAAGHGERMWRAYLSTPPADGRPAVNARDRIGNGPWFNVEGVPIAADAADLHSENNRLATRTALTERAQPVPDNHHDILTGSNPDGTLAAGTDVTCGGWISNSTSGRAMLGHSNKRGGGERPRSWNSAHLSAGCSQSNLVKTGGSGLFYCFASN